MAARAHLSIAPEDTALETSARADGAGTPRRKPRSKEK